MSTDTKLKPVPTRVAAEREQRRRRSDLTPMSRAPLAVPGAKLDPNYKYRWVDDIPGRVQQLTVNDDYDPVTYADLGLAPMGLDSNSGTTVERVSDKQSGRKTVLLRKRKDWYQHDKAKEQQALDTTMAALKRGHVPTGSNGEGGVMSDGGYIPRSGIRIEDGRRG